LLLAISPYLGIFYIEKFIRLKIGIIDGAIKTKAEKCLQ